ncbi:MAG: hypothetical protein IJS39_13735 [Synergistaceae bacterium]|nr:hypothetical protein [Synergistaceae bacterium]
MTPFGDRIEIVRSIKYVDAAALSTAMTGIAPQNGRTTSRNFPVKASG